ncbi:MAG: glycerol-3-phosphate acyltransferase [Anaerolineae bacterium]|nr:glycerol-3-phosphate acyltransferase [Anaerolineae bacterium]
MSYELLLNIILWSTLAFLSSAVPWSVIVGRLSSQADIRVVGDHNPGAFNVLRAAGPMWFILAVLLDGFKAAIPVGLAWYVFGVANWGIVPIGFASVAGHVFSPFLHFRGGKAVASTFGLWAGLTLGVGPTLLGLLLLLMYNVVAVSGWAVLLTMLSWGGFVVWYYGPVHPPFVGAWLANLALLIWTHRSDLCRPPGLHSRVLHLLKRDRP